MSKSIQSPDYIQGYEVIVKEYDSVKKTQRGNKKLAKQGYTQTGLEVYKPKTGGCRLLMGGFLFGRKKEVFLVTYQRPVGENG